MAIDKPQWRELFSEVVTSGLCTGCAACVVACPHPVLDYETANGAYKPFHLDIDGGPEDCTHGQKGCTMCTRACPRFRNWESEIDTRSIDAHIRRLRLKLGSARNHVETVVGLGYRFVK